MHATAITDGTNNNTCVVSSFLACHKLLCTPFILITKWGSNLDKSLTHETQKTLKVKSGVGRTKKKYKYTEMQYYRK